MSIEYHHNIKIWHNRSYGVDFSTFLWENEGYFESICTTSANPPALLLCFPAVLGNTEDSVYKNYKEQKSIHTQICRKVQILDIHSHSCHISTYQNFFVTEIIIWLIFGTEIWLIHILFFNAFVKKN